MGREVRSRVPLQRVPRDWRRWERKVQTTTKRKEWGITPGQGKGAGKKDEEVDEEKNLSLEAVKEPRKAGIVETPKGGNGKGRGTRDGRHWPSDTKGEMATSEGEEASRGG